MGNSSKLWRFSDRLPVSIQAALIFISLILVLSTVSFQMLPASTWGDNIDKLLLGVSWVTNSKNFTSNFTESPQISSNFTSTSPHGTVENLYQNAKPDESPQSFETPSPTGAVDYEETTVNNTESGNATFFAITLAPESNPPTSTVAVPLASSPPPAPAAVVSPTLAMSVEYFMLKFHDNRGAHWED